MPIYVKPYWNLKKKKNLENFRTIYIYVKPYWNLKVSV